MRLDPDFGDLAELRSKMVAWARKLTRGGHQAEDLVQTALLKMLANRHRAPVLPDISPWAMSVLLNTFRDGLRSDRRQPLFVDYENLPLTAPDNPETAVYCRQVCRIAFGLDAEFLLAEPESPQTNTQRTQRRRARLQLEARVAA